MAESFDAAMLHVPVLTDTDISAVLKIWSADRHDPQGLARQ